MIAHCPCHCQRCCNCHLVYPRPAVIWTPAVVIAPWTYTPPSPPSLQEQVAAAVTRAKGVLA